jgi:hypothetical protein
MTLTGCLQKMPTYGNTPVQYELTVYDPDSLEITNRCMISDFLQHTLSIHFSGTIYCQHCGNKTPKSYNQGYCYSCFISLAQCDMCIMKPELCQYTQGLCRQPEWGEKHCMIPHTVYLANSSNIKVGITRTKQQETRWRDQGATQAIVLGIVKNRLESGLVETKYKQLLADRTNWRKMLSGQSEPLNMHQLREQYLAQWPVEIPNLAVPEQVQTEYQFEYPVLTYPTKITSLNLDKTPTVTGTLLGIKGQYLLLSSGVINIRKYAGYFVDVTLQEQKNSENRLHLGL